MKITWLITWFFTWFFLSGFCLYWEVTEVLFAVFMHVTYRRYMSFKCSKEHCTYQARASEPWSLQDERRWKKWIWEHVADVFSEFFAPTKTVVSFMDQSGWNLRNTIKKSSGIEWFFRKIHLPTSCFILVNVNENL